MYLEACFRVLPEDPARSVQDDGEMLRSELLQVSHGRPDFFFRIVFFRAHPASKGLWSERARSATLTPTRITHRLSSSTAFSCMFLPL